MRIEALSLADARRVLLSAVRSLPPEDVPLPEASGRIVQGTIVARVSLPPEDHATVDGYAVRVGDIGGGRGEGLRLAGTVTAGLTAPPPLLPGYCMAITTGAPLPPGTEAVVPVEAARRTDDVVLVASPPLLGNGIRRAGEEVRTGDVLVLPGTLAQPRTLERLAAQGVTQVPVSRRAHVHLIATGDELVPPGQAPGLGERVASNLPMLEALVRAAGGYLERSVVIPDDPGQLREALAEAANGDLLLTVGGTLHGSKDLTKAALCRALLRALHGWASPLPAFRARLAERLPPAGEETLLVASVVQETAAGLEFHRRGQGWPALGRLAPCPAGSDPDPHITVEPFPLGGAEMHPTRTSCSKRTRCKEGAKAWHEAYVRVYVAVPRRAPDAADGPFSAACLE